MQVECFMKIEANSPVPKGGSSDSRHKDEIELLSFEHVVKRTPTRSDRSQSQSLNQLRSRIAKKQAQGDLGFYGSWGLRNMEQKESGDTVRLAATLEHNPVTVLKVVDKSSPALWKWSTLRELLTSVTFSMRTLSSKVKDKFELLDVLQLKLEGAYICDMEMVGSYPDQPWLKDMSPALWESAPRLDVGPIERIEIGYQKITWSVNVADSGTGKVCGWDVEAKKAYTAA